MCPFRLQQDKPFAAPFTVKYPNDLTKAHEFLRTHFAQLVTDDDASHAEQGVAATPRRYRL